MKSETVLKTKEELQNGAVKEERSLEEQLAEEKAKVLDYEQKWPVLAEMLQQANARATELEFQLRVANAKLAKALAPKKE